MTYNPMNIESIKERLELLNEELSNYAEDCKLSRTESELRHDYNTANRQTAVISVLGHCRSRILDIIKDI